jgi:hypothetical protein
MEGMGDNAEVLYCRILPWATRRKAIIYSLHQFLLTV